MYKVFVDGSCPKNGLEGAIGGWGYILTDSDFNIVAEEYGKLRRGQQSSTRAELEALYRSLLLISKMKDDMEFEIITDYKTLVELITGLGTRSANRDIWDLIEPIMISMVGRISVSHINSHTGNEDNLSKLNSMVDRLAKQGANSLLIAPVE